MNRIALFIVFLILSNGLHSQNTKKVPAFEEVISLQSVSNPKISPEGMDVVYQVRQTDWEKNGYDTEIWLAKNQEQPFQLTNTKEGSSSNPKWSPDGKWISFVAKRGDKSQIHVIRAAGGEAMQVTHMDKNIYGYEWSPDGSQFLFITTDENKGQKEAIEKRYGDYAVEDEVFARSQLWIINFEPDSLLETELPAYMKDTSKKEDLPTWKKPLLVTDSTEFTISDYYWSPDGKSIAIEHQPDAHFLSFMKTDISILDIDTKAIRPLVTNAGSDNLAGWSPDSKSILFSSYEDDTVANFYKNDKLFRIDVDGKNLKQLAKDFDEYLRSLKWTEEGIYATGFQKTNRPLFRINPKNGKVAKINTGVDRVFSFDITPDGTRIAFSGENDDELGEIYAGTTDDSNYQKISNTSNQIQDWKVAQSELIQWESKDGAIIEGVLHKPLDYDPNKKYPLMVIIHGGPTGIDRPQPVPGYVYPVLQWLDKGALVLRPNYRGSAGYGEDFRSLNVENLGVGDAWDVLSGIDYLDQKGMIDTTKMGAMGWSQGGYISAFLTTTTNRFKAISVGAGISNWVTYYVNTDIHPFTRQYLKANPWEDMEIYEKTSPMTYIRQAATPTLIQHGEFDKRVPIPNAYELMQGLQDMGVDTKLVVYKGFGHGITKPKERLAATWHNWQWFGKYIWGEEIELPVEQK